VPFERPRALSMKRDPRFLQIEDAIWQVVEETAATGAAEVGSLK